MSVELMTPAGITVGSGISRYEGRPCTDADSWVGGLYETDVLTPKMCIFDSRLCWLRVLHL